MKKLLIPLILTAMIGLFWPQGEKTAPPHQAQQQEQVRGNIAHIMLHTRPDSSKPIHSVFTLSTREEVEALLVEAWGKRGKPKSTNRAQGRKIYEVNMQRVIGTKGERRLRMVVDADSGYMITAYPVR